MFIPAETLIFPNIRYARYASSETRILTGIGNMLNRGMTLDENIYTNPTAFVPERYLLMPVGNAEPYFGGKFGFGRR
jgi:hypothetical protein